MDPLKWNEFEGYKRKGDKTVTITVRQRQYVLNAIKYDYNGKYAKFMVTGDPGQIDLPRRVISGLKEALLILKETNGIGIVKLDQKDVIRHSLVKKVIDAYDRIEHNN